MISANRMGMKALPKITTTKSLVSSLFVVALIACCPIQTRADTIALSFTPSDGTFFGGAGSLTLGWGFSLSSALDVTQLGVWDQNGNGLAQSHMVTIWNSTGTAVAQVMIPSGYGGRDQRLPLCVYRVRAASRGQLHDWRVVWCFWK